MANETVSDFVGRKSWALAEIEAGFEEAQRRDFSSDPKVASVLAKYQAKPTAAAVISGA